MTDKKPQWSYSRVEAYKQCPYKFKLRYVDNLTAIPDQEAANALILGKALHEGIRFGTEKGLAEYEAGYSILSDAHIHEQIKLETMILKAREALADVLSRKTIFEYELETPEYHGFIDLVAYNLDGTVNLYDFKYSNNRENYLKSGQLSVYKYFWELLTGIKVRGLKYVFVDKSGVRQKMTETAEQFRERLKTELTKKGAAIIDVNYNHNSVLEFLEAIKQIPQDTEYLKQQSNLCKWCDFEPLCKEGLDYMLLPKNERRDIKALTKKTIWIYGPPFSGKTYFANKFPAPLMLNTDGNVKFVDAPFIPIKDMVEMNGRIKNTTLGWQVFKDTVDELEKKQNDFKTIIVDLVEDLYELCRYYIYNKRGISHESDDSMRAWDMVRTEFLSTIRKLVNLDYENIILISHEDKSRDFTKKTGDKVTAIKPNLGDKPAAKLAGMVDLVGRVTADENTRTLSLKNDAVVFGGGRLSNFSDTEINLDYDAFLTLYQKAAGSPKAPEAELKTQTTERQPRVSVKE